jgi:hypothetical protein
MRKQDTLTSVLSSSITMTLLLLVTKSSLSIAPAAIHTYAYCQDRQGIRHSDIPDSAMAHLERFHDSIYLTTTICRNRRSLKQPDFGFLLYFSSLSQLLNNVEDACHHITLVLRIAGNPRSRSDFQLNIALEHPRTHPNHTSSRAHRRLPSLRHHRDLRRRRTSS